MIISSKKNPISTKDNNFVSSAEKALLVTATDEVPGAVQLATSAETQTGTETAKAVTPASLAARTATDSRAGLVELATSAETQAGTDATRAVTPAGLKAYTEWRPSGMKNLLINGNFDIWQRGDGPFTFATSPTYLADRWQGYCSVASSLVVSRSNNSMRIERTSDFSTWGSVRQVLESRPGLSGKATFSCDMRREAGTGAPYIAIAGITGENNTVGLDSASLTVSTTPTLTSTFQRVSVTATIPEYSGKAYTIACSIFFNDTTAPITVDIRNCQLELGPIATPFEQRPIGLELELCRRYYQKRAMYVGDTPSSMRIDMRAAPTITGGGTGFASTGTTADTLICSQTTGAVQTLAMAAEI